MTASGGDREAGRPAGQSAAGPCANCGDASPGNYCPACGQRRAERRISLRRMLAEVIEDQLSVNATLPRTLRALFFQPGFLSREYLAGRIQRYVPPFRLYLASSVLFFLLLSLRAGSNPIVNMRGQASADSARSLVRIMAEADTTEFGTEAGRELAAFRTGWEALDTVGNRRVRELAELPPRQAAVVLSRAILQRAPTAVFLLLPCYALLLKLLYVGRRRFYVEHFVFGLHTHAFAFVLFTVMLLASGVPWLNGLLVGWLLLYGFLALKRFYGDGALRTFFKYGLLGMLYGMVLAAGLLVTVVVALLLG